jgi:peptide-methionine (S)-S-oxide reductase
MKRLAPALRLLFVILAASVRADSIVLGGGCFWCMDAAFKLLPGVTHVTCGYAGGTTKYPTYRDVGTETTGHAEVVQVEFNPRKVSLQEVLQYFWECHNPTQVDGQGDDLGPSYRSIILYADDTQRVAALASRAEAQKRFSDPIATEIAPLTKFWVAEDYHQDYFDKHPDQDYCRIVIRPKVIKLQHLLGQ